MTSTVRKDKDNRLPGEGEKVGGEVLKEEVGDGEDDVVSAAKRLAVVKDLVGLLKKKLNGMLLHTTYCYVYYQLSRPRFSINQTMQKWPLY